MTRDDAKTIIDALPMATKKAIALFVLTAEAQGGYTFDGESSVYSDNAQETLHSLAKEILNIAELDSLPEDLWKPGPVGGS